MLCREEGRGGFIILLINIYNQLYLFVGLSAVREKAAIMLINFRGQYY